MNPKQNRTQLYDTEGNLHRVSNELSSHDIPKKLSLTGFVNAALGGRSGKVMLIVPRFCWATDAPANQERVKKKNVLGKGPIVGTKELKPCIEYIEYQMHAGVV